jgi:exodeoxyribonuclease V alpha subunit
MGLMPSITIRVTNILSTYKSGKMRFRGVPVCPDTHKKTSERDFYNITATPEQAVFEPEIGQVWKINGDAYVEEKSSYKKHGVDRHHDIRKAKQCVCILPRSKESFVAFIKEIKAFKGVGKGKAEALWDEFNLETLKHMEHGRTSMLATVVTPKMAKSLVNGYSKYRNLKYAFWLMSKGIPIEIQKMVFEFKPIINPKRTHQSGYSYAIDPRDIIKENPYRLASCFSMQFLEVDKLVRRGFEPNINSADPRRMVAAVSQAIRTCSKGGHTFATYDKLLKELVAILQQAELIASLNKSYNKLNYNIEELAATALTAHDKDAYVIYPNGQYQLTHTYLMENVIALRLLSMRSHGAVFGEAESAACEKAFELSPHPLLSKQKDAVITAVESRISAIIGGAGTGKTTVLHAVLTAYEALGYVSNADINLEPDKIQYNRNIKTMALSCRAAKRMRDSINKSSNGAVRERQINATSISRFLHETIIEDAEGKYLIVIDEASMLDVATMYHIITNIHPNVRILLVGDHHQLPPIGAGNVLADVVGSGVIPLTELDIVKRQSSATGIPEYSKSVREGIVPDGLSTGSIHFHEVTTDLIAETCAKLYAASPATSMVVASTNALVGKVNELCQQSVNPNGESFLIQETDFFPDFVKHPLSTLRKGDPILFTANISQDIQNGSLGKLTSVARDNDSFGLVKMDDEYVEISPTEEMLPTLNLGYGLTVHKAQGSQFPRVIVALHGGHVDRAWLYTAITRAEGELHIVSTKEKLISTIERKSHASKRKTMLKTLLQEGADQT